MINSTSSSDHTQRALSINGSVPAERSVRTGSDNFSASQAALLHNAMARHPEIRPEVVTRGRELAADPAYPPPAVQLRVAAAILRSPDLTEE